MNLLIIGGLMAVGLLAILGAVFLGLSEQRAENRVKQPPLPVEPSVPTLAAAPVPIASAAQRAMDEMTSIQRSFPPRQEPSRLAGNSYFPSTALNGQFREMANEIRTLYQQASQLEQRLSVLNDMVDHIERSQNSHVGIDEEKISSQETKPFSMDR